MNLNKLSDYIHNGPLITPCLYESRFFSLFYAQEKRKAEFHLQWQDIRGKIQSNINEPFNNDKFYRMKQLLSIWFLTEPRKVQLAINDTQSRAAEVGTKSYKALNITLNTNK